ncbi:MAG: hypothetical protein V4644_03085 [Patescibacteria group bacterium]
MITGCDETQFGILAELARVGFGHTDRFQKDGGNYVRVTRIIRGELKAMARYRYDIVSPRTELWLGGREKAREVIRWWKSPALVDSCETAVLKHAGFSLDKDQSFVMDGRGVLVQRSQKLLTTLS